MLRAAVEEARGEPGTYVTRARVLGQTNTADLEEFTRIARHLAERGFIAEGENDCEFFVLTLEASLRAPGIEAEKRPAP